VNRRTASNRPRRARQATGSFSKRFEDLEQKRTALLARLAAFGERAPAHPSHKRALTLLNASFRKASLVQRVAIVEAAAWLIDLIEVSLPML
jgi:hypothetical protein